MKFYSEPNFLVRPRKNGAMKRFRPFRFDENGVYETENLTLIKAMKRKFKYDGNEPHETEETIEELLQEELNDESIRSLAKERKIKSWHVKSIETLKEELGV